MAKATAKSNTQPKATGAGARRTKVVVREAGPADQPALRALRRLAERTHARLMPDYFREAPSDAGAVWDPEQGPWSAVLVAAPATAAGVRVGVRAVIDHDVAVLGFVAIRVVVTPRDPAMVPRRRAHVEVIVVDEGHRGAGIGTALMRAATAWAREREATEMVLTVWADNVAADALYRSLGYHPIARVLRRKL